MRRPSPRLIGLLVGVALAVTGCAAASSARPAASGSSSAEERPAPADIVIAASRATPGEPLVDPREIRSGGVGVDGIPPIDKPVTVTAGQAARDLVDTEPVLLVTVAGQTRAYPMRVLVRHEIVNDEIAGQPLVATWCPLCNTGVVFDRRVNGEVLDFGVSGQLYQSALVMYDRQSESLWTQPDGRAVLGTATGATLDVLPASTVTWRDAVSSYPDLLVVAANAAELAKSARNPYEGYEGTDDPFLFAGTVDPRLAAGERVVGVTYGGQAMAWAHSWLAEHRVVTATVGGQRLVVLFEPTARSTLDTADVREGREVGSAGVFDPVVDGRRLTLAPAGATGFTDAETGSTWTAAGVATAGPLAGSSLRPLPHLDAFWFAWAAYNPGTGLAA